MRHRKHRRRDNAPAFIDPAFAEALDQSSFRKSNRDARSRNHKAQMLCRQAQRALSLAIAEFAGDEILRDVFIAEVTPSPDGSRLMVHVTVPANVSVADALARLADAAPRLRAEVAQAITRKRAPELSFIPAAMSEGGMS